MPQRLAAAFATPEVKIGGTFTSAAKRSLKDEPVVVVPTMSVRVPQERRESCEIRLRELVEKVHPGAGSTAQPAQIRFSSGETLTALAIADVARRRTRKIARKLGVDYLWLVKDGHAALRLTEAKTAVPEGTTTDEQAGSRGESLRAVIKESVGDVEWLASLPRWTTAARPGWVKGGRLQLPCEDCDRELEWADWWNADAVRMKKNAFVYCPHHGGPVTKHRGQPLHTFIHARQQLDGAVWAQGSGAKRFNVYAFELLGLGPDEMYVGQTTKTQEERWEEHKALGKTAAKILRSGKAQIGPLRECRLPELPPLHSSQAAYAAEHWTSLWLILQGVDVHGDGAH